MLVLVRSFSYTPRAGFSEEFLVQSSGRFSEEFALHSWSCFSEDFLLHSWCYFLSGVSLTLLMLVLVRCFSSTPDASFSQEFLLHSSSWF